MKLLHRPNFFSWSVFDEARNLDFHGLALIRDDGNVLVDPLPMSDHDLAHLESLGGASTIVITNSDHVRAAASLAARFGAKVAGPTAERDAFPIVCDRWLDAGDHVASGIVVCVLEGSKTPGELALVVDGSALITGDLIRAHRGGALALLPDTKLVDKAKVITSLRSLAEIETIDAVLVGDGWPVFRDGHRALVELLRSVDPTA